MPTKKVLLIAYFFPPLNTIGAVRAAKFARMLPEFGWEPVVLTRDWQATGGLPAPADLPVVRTGYTDRLGMIRAVRNPVAVTAAQCSASAPPAPPSLKSRLRKQGIYWAKEFLVYPDEFTGWRSHALQAARQILREQPVDLIFSTAQPFTCHLIAHQLALETGLPWVADFRDPWTQGPAYNHTELRAFFERRLEKATLCPARLLTTVSQPWADGLHALHGKPVAVIANGYDEADFGDPPPQTPTFTLTYTGRIYDSTHLVPGYTGCRDPRPLFDATRLLLDRGVITPETFQIRFFGPPSEQSTIYRIADSAGVRALIQHAGEVPYYDSLRRQQESTALLLLNWKAAENTFREQGWFTAKIYEYLRALRPILAVPPHTGVDAILKDTGSGLSAGTPDRIATILENWYTAFTRNGFLEYHGDWAAIQRYTRRDQTRKLALMFNQAIGRSEPDMAQAAGIGIGVGAQ